MPSDRDLAQQWLAERLGEVVRHIDCDPDKVHDLAAAILDTPGVEVETTPLYEWPGGHLDNNRYRVEQPPTHRQLVIRLPTEPIGDEAAWRRAAEADVPVEILAERAALGLSPLGGGAIRPIDDKEGR